MKNISLSSLFILLSSLMSFAQENTSSIPKTPHSLQSDLKTLEGLGYQYDDGAPGHEVWRDLRSRFVERGSSAVPVLIELYEKSNNRTLNSHIAVILADIGDERAVPVLIAGLVNPYETLKTMGDEDISALIQMAPVSVPYLLESFIEGDTYLRGQIAPALLEIDDLRESDILEEFVPDLFALFDEVWCEDAPFAHVNTVPDKIRRCVKDILVRIGHPSFAGFISRLYYEDYGIRMTSAACLGEMGEPAALDELIILAEQDPHPDVRLNAIFSLGKIGDERTIPCLRSILFSPLPDLDCGIAAIVLADLLGYEAAPDLVYALEQVTECYHVRDITKALGKIRYGESVEPLKRGLEFRKKNEIDIWKASMWALGRSGNLDALPIVLEALNSNDRYKRSIALDALRDLRHESAIAAILGMADDPDIGIARCAVIYVMEITDTREIWPSSLGNDREKIREIATILQDMYYSGELTIKPAVEEDK